MAEICKYCATLSHPVYGRLLPREFIDIRGHQAWRHRHNGDHMFTTDCEIQADEEKKPEFVITASEGMGHAVNTYMGCPSCGGYNFEVRNYDMMWHDGDVYCLGCGAYVRGYDAG